MTGLQQAPGRRRSRHMPAVVAGGIAASLVSMGLFGKVSDEVLEHETMAFDTRVVEEAREMVSPRLDRAMSVVTATGEPWAQMLVCGAVALRWWRAGRRTDVATMLLASVAGGALNGALKLIFRRERPALKLRRAHASGPSYPSGHAMTTLATYGTLAYLVSRRGGLTGHPQARLVWMPVLALCSLVGWSRVYLEVHYPTDVVGGWTAGAI